jgi:hypothetical protein
MHSGILELSAPHEVVPMLGLPSEQPARRELTSSVGVVFRSISRLMNSLLLRALDAHTREEFERAFFGEVFRDYVRLLRSFSEIAETIMPLQQIARLSVDTFDDLERDLRSRGDESFGAEMTERALFTVFALRKITPLLYSIVTSNQKLAPCDVDKDREFAKKFLVHALVARFCVDCLIVAMDKNKMVYPDVLASINDLMRSVVDAYAWVRQAVALRAEKQQVMDYDAAFPPLDEDDRQLLRESMIDLSLGKI